MQTQNQLIFRHDLKAGDLGKLIMYAGIYSNADFGYPLAFEGYVAKTFAEYIINPQPKDRIWIVEESDGKFVGSVAVLDRGEAAQLRWYNVDPKWRGKGIGKRIFDEALTYCKEQGFKKTWLSTFTDSELAIGIYERRGFSVIERKQIELAGRELTELIFEKNL